ncbi:unnamed protein product [Sphagnum balticum]
MKAGQPDEQQCVPTTNVMNWHNSIKVALPLAIVSVCLFGCVLDYQSDVFRELHAALLLVQWMLLVCLAVWCSSFIFLTFGRRDLPLIGLLLIAIAMYFISYTASAPAADAIILLAGVTLGKAARFFVGDEVTSLISKSKNEKWETRNKLETPYVVSYFLFGNVILLAFSAWWHLDIAGTYHGPRSMGLWDNPNIYGMLMGAGVTLAIGLFVENRRRRGDESHFEKQKVECGKRQVVRVSSRCPLPIILFIAAGMMAVGLFFSYSRGAWVGTVIGLLYLAWSYGKLKWRYVIIGAGLVALGVVLFWGHTADNAPWYLKRLDLSRPSAQHRVSAWRGAFQMMRDHPFGVGWNKAVETYDRNYSPPEGGAAALTMNSYLMVGTELALPGLICFVAYVWLSFCGRARHSVRASAMEVSGAQGATRPIVQTVCRAGALVLVVAFWFDGGLFDLPTASVFWILLELGSVSTHISPIDFTGRS